MHFQLHSSDLIKGVNLVTRAVASRDQIPELTGIKLEVQQNSLTMTANDLQIAIKTTIPCTTFEVGEHIVSGILFSELVAKLPQENVIIKWENDQVNIQAGTSEFNLHSIPSENFPEYPSCDQPILSIADTELSRLIRCSSFAASNDDHRPIFSGVLLEQKDGNMHFVATDSNRLVFVQGQAELTEGDRQFIIPKTNLLELSRSLPLTDDQVQVFYGDSQLAFRFAETIFTSRLIDGVFPNYRAVLYTEQQTSFVIKKMQFIQALERASLFSRFDDTPVIVKVEAGVLQIDTTSKVGKSQEQYAVEQRGPDQEAAFAPKFILDMLKTMGGDLAEFRFEQGRQALIKPSNQDDYLYILMPIRI